MYQGVGVLASRVLQRGMLVWKRQIRRHQKASQVAASTLIASMIRRCRSIRVVHVLRQQASARRIQSVWRGSQARKGVRHMCMQRDNARRIQQKFRWV